MALAGPTCNKSLIIATFSGMFKIAKVIPVHKRWEPLMTVFPVASFVQILENNCTHGGYETLRN